MGRLRKRFNEKARRKKDIRIQHSADEKISVLSDDLKNQQQDDSNALILPSKKRKTKDVTQSATKVKLLSKKQRKKLEQIVQRKEKKQKRAGLLESLQSLQGDTALLQQLTAVTSVQTAGLKRTLRPPRSVGGTKRARQNSGTAEDEEAGGPDASDPNVVGTEVHMESDSSDEEEEDEEEPAAAEAGPSSEAAASPSPPAPEPGPSSPVVENHSKKVSKQKTRNSGKPAAKRKTKTNGKVASKLTDEDSSEKVTKQSESSVESDLQLQHVPVLRSREIQEARLKLPILAEEQAIVETIREHPVTVLAGETGSGKTTQVPQFLYEAGYARERMIGVTEPRRVAAVSMSRRVAEEMALTADLVSYQIRFEGNTTSSTRLKFMTDGVLLKEIETDFLLSKYSVIILDEAHERSVYTDILVGLLSRIVPLRQKRASPLKLIIMSATLRVTDFTENSRLFRVPPPVVKVESRQFPVTIHWSKRTPDDYAGEAFRKACKIHRTLPDGGILIFLTGQAEVTAMVQRLRRAFPLPRGSQVERTGQRAPQSAAGPQQERPPLTEAEEEELFFNPKLARQRKTKEVVLPEIDLDSYAVQPPGEEEAEGLEGSDADGSESEDEEELVAPVATGSEQPLHVLPLYAMLSTERQQQVFEPVPAGSRLCVVATNVAETSLTIPGIKYVVDTGKVKQKLYDKTTGVSAFMVMWCSQAGANQRAGRAGRVAPGHCYRLYSSALFNDEMAAFAPPEMQRRPVQDVLLQMKAMHIARVANFPFPSPPDRDQLRAAEESLLQLGALERPPAADKPGSAAAAETRVTPLGRAMSCFPVSPRYAKMLALSQQHGLLPYTVCLVAALTVQQVLLENPLTDVGREQAARLLREWAAVRRSWAGTGHSLLLGDAAVLIRAVGAAEFASGSPDFCQRYGLRLKAVREIRRLRVQLSSQVALAVPAAASEAVVDPRQPPPTQPQCALLRQLLLSALPDHVAKRVEPDEIKNPEDRPKWKNSYRCTSVAEPVFLHRGSVLRRERPQFVVYQEIYETNKLYMRGVTAVEPEWLSQLCPDMCTFSQPLPEPPPHFDDVTGRVMCHVNATFGPLVWPLPAALRVFPSGLERYRRFAVHLLQGEVCPPLAAFAAALLAPPATMTKSWARLHPRTESLLKALVAEGCDCRDALLRAWRAKTGYLLSAYQEWVPEVLHEKVAALWPPCDRQDEDEPAT